MSRWSGGVFALVALSLVLAAAPALAQSTLYGFYLDELSRNADGPAVSRSVWAGRVLPASWSATGHSGFYLDWLQDDNPDVSSDWSTVLSLKHLGFSARHQAGGGREATDYTMGLSLGNRTASFGLGYGWQTGSEQILGGAERTMMNFLWRTRWTSISAMTAYDLEAFESVDHFSLGVRPFGPRWTVYGEMLGWRNEPGMFRYGRGYEETTWAWGADAKLVPGLTVGARFDEDGAFGVRLSLGLDGSRPQATYRADADGDYLATTWAVELAPGPKLREIMPTPKAYPQIDMRGAMTYRRYGYFDHRPRFLQILAQINAVSEDPHAGGVVLNLSGVHTSAANLWELRAQLAGLRERGKTVSIYFDRLNSAGYALATVADEVWIDPLGEIDLKGLNFGRSYYKEALAKLGIGFDEWRFFEYKSAVEAFSRTSFSEGEKEQLTALMQDFWADISTTIREARGIDASAMQDIVDKHGVVEAFEAEKLGLVDVVGDFNDLVENARFVALHAPRGGQVARLGPLLGDRIWRQEEWSELPQIAVLYAIGPCAMDSGIRGRQLSKEIRKVRMDPGVKAVVLRADSPGGDPLPSDLVARELRETAKLKPVIVSQGQVAGSGGYWISMYGDEILASPLTVTGSIGVISGHIYDAGISKKLGIDYDHVQIGRGADINSGPGLPVGGLSIPHRNVTDEERARAKDVILGLYDNFVDAVAEGRGMEREDVAAIAQGHIYSGTAGLKNGLVDEIGGLWDAIVLAKEAAGLAPDASISLREGPDLGRFGTEFLKPSLIGMRLAEGFRDRALMTGTTVPETAETDVWVQDRPEFLESVFSAAQWTALSPIERAWMQQIFLAPRRPVTMMDPVDFGDWMPGGSR